MASVVVDVAERLVIRDDGRKVRNGIAGPLPSSRDGPAYGPLYSAHLKLQSLTGADYPYQNQIEMGKKKTEPSKVRQPRQKKLRLVDHSPIGLTDEQQKELRQLYRPIADRPFPSLDDREAHRRSCLDRFLYLYMELLCYDAQVETGNLRKRKTANDRRKLLAEMNKLYGRELSPDDLVKELTRHAPVPRFAKDAIRRDYLRITV